MQFIGIEVDRAKHVAPAEPSHLNDLQREKAQVEMQMLRLKSDINAIENQLNHNNNTERVSTIITLMSPSS